MLPSPSVDYIEGSGPFERAFIIAVLLIGIEREMLRKTVASKVVPRSSQAPSVFSGISFSIRLSNAFRRQMPQLVCHPIPKRIIGDVPVSVDEYGSAGEVSEHNAGVAGGHVEAVDSGVGEVFPVGHKDNAERKNVRAHDLHLAPKQSFFSCRGTLVADLPCFCELNRNNILCDCLTCARAKSNP